MGVREKFDSLAWARGKPRLVDFNGRAIAPHHEHEFGIEVYPLRDQLEHQIGTCHKFGHRTLVRMDWAIATVSALCDWGYSHFKIAKANPKIVSVILKRHLASASILSNRAFISVLKSENRVFISHLKSENRVFIFDLKSENRLSI